MARSKYTKHRAADEFEEQPKDSPTTDDVVSRSARKRDSDAMKALGMQLAELSPKQLGEMDLDEALYKAITDYQRITSNSAKRRQRGYIGGLLRSEREATDAIRSKFAAITEHDANAKRIHHELEDWRERLIAEDTALTEFLDKYTDAQAQPLRTLIRRVRTAKDDAQRKLATRALYRAVADIAQA